jgi:hypothetical protein
MDMYLATAFQRSVTNGVIKRFSILKLKGHAPTVFILKVNPISSPPSSLSVLPTHYSLEKPDLPNGELGS